MIIVPEVAPKLKSFLSRTGLKPLAQLMMLRVVLTFIMHRRRMSCSAAAGAIAAEPIHRRELTRFLERPRWQKHDFNRPLMRMLLAKEKKRGKFMFLIDATLVSQSGKKTQNTFSSGNRTSRKIKKGFRYNKKKVMRKHVHSFTFGLLITPSGIRIPMQIPHRTKEYCAEHGIQHMTTAEAAAEMIRTQPGMTTPKSSCWATPLTTRKSLKRRATRKDTPGFSQPTPSGFTKDRLGSGPSCVLD